MPNLDNRIPIRVQSFNGGQNSSGESTVVQMPFVSSAQNILINNLGQAEQREGIAVQGDNPASLISKWTFGDGTSVDDKGENDGTDTAVIYTNKIDGKFGVAAQFNGTTSKITVDADTTIDVVDTEAFTLSAWVYVSGDGGSDVGRIIDKWSGTEVGYRLWVHSEASSKVKVSCEVGHGTTNALCVTDATVITLNTWTRVDATYDGTDILLYINGALATTTDTSGVGDIGDDGAVDLTIGNETAASAKGFYGILDDVRIYNTALTAAEVQQSICYGLYRFRVGTTIDKIFRIRNNALESLDADLLDWTIIDDGFTANLKTNFVIGRKSDGTYAMFIFNGTDNVHSLATDGTTVTDEGNTNTDPPRGTEAEWHDNRLFVITSTGDINYSDILDGQTFDRTTNIFNTKSQAKAIKSFKEKELIIYEEKSIEVLNTSGATPLEDWSKTLLNESIEFNSPRTVVNVENDQIFLARDGVRLLSRTSFDKIQAGIISQPIQDIIDRINQDAIDTACAWFINNKYYLAIPLDTETQPNKVVIYDTQAAILVGNPSSGWTVTEDNDWFPSVMSEFELGDNKTRLLFGDNRALSKVYANTGNIDNGRAVTSEIIGIDHVVDGMADGVWDPVQVVAHSGIATTISVKAEVDRGGFVDANPATMDLTGGAPVLPIALPFSLGGSDTVRQVFRTKNVGRGRTCRVKLSHNTYNVRPTYVEYTIYGRPIKTRGF